MQVYQENERQYKSAKQQPDSTHRQGKADPFLSSNTHVNQLKAYSDWANSSEKVTQLRSMQQLADRRPVQRVANNNGLPDNLKSGIENLSGYSMNDVKVHYNSDKPAQLNAHAYAQGSSIHLAPGQEKHLPHEAWHVVQQKQGRVKPTMQLKGKVSINDDAGLEREADLMGTKALQIESSASVPSGLRDQSSNENNPVQRRVEPNPGVHLQNKGSYYWILNHPFDELATAYGNIFWINLALEAYETIVGARANVEDDDEANSLTGYENSVDALVTRGNQEIVEFNATVNRIAISERLIATRLGITAIVAALHEKYRAGGGGFGAVGRATEVEDRTVEEGARGGGPNASDRFIRNVNLNGTLLTAGARVAGQSPAQVAGPIVLNEASREDLEALPEPRANQEKRADQNFAAVGRGDGQAAAMAGTNARGYAHIYRIAGWNQTRWEWLHIRGASLGGATDSRNLVVGTRDANTQMMPFESNMKSLENAVNGSAYYAGVRATWSPANRVQRHAYNTIMMTWEAVRTERGVRDNARRITGTVEINPLTVGNVLSKNEIRYIEEALREIRADIPQPVEAMDVSDEVEEEA